MARQAVVKGLVVLLGIVIIGLAGGNAAAVPDASLSGGTAGGALLQFKAGNHILGFTPEKAYMVGMGYAVIEEFVGANRVMPVSAGGTKTGQGAEMAPVFEGVQYPELWKGITLKYVPAKTGLAETVYVISPGADAGQIRLRYNAKVVVQKDGSLRISHPGKRGYFTQSAPVAWQEVQGLKRTVEVAFAMHGEDTIGFTVGEYDRGLPLVIDPMYQWHTFYGSGGNEIGNGIAVDTVGNVYVTGMSTASWNGDGDAPPLHPHSGAIDIFVLKLNTNGVYEWHTFYGSAGDEEGYGIAVGGGHVYVTGFTGSTWSVNGAPPLNTTPGGGLNIFVLKLAANGAYQWHTFYGSGGTDYGRGIAVDKSGNVYVTGRSDTPWLGLAVDPLHPYPGSWEIFVLKLTANGVYQWHTFYGGGTYDEGYGIAVDDNGNVYVAGMSGATWNGDADTPPLHPHSGAPLSEIFVLKLDTDGVYQWHTFYGGVGHDYGYGIAVDNSGNVYVTGSSENSWRVGGFDPLHPYSRYNDIFVLKLDHDGTYRWHTFYGGWGDDYGRRIASDNNGNVYVTGQSSQSWNGDGDTPPLHPHNGGYMNMFVLTLSAFGTYQWHTFYGAPTLDDGCGIAVDGSGSVYVTGRSVITWNGDDGAPPLHPYSASSDIVVLKLSPTVETCTLTVTINGTGSGTVTSGVPTVPVGALPAGAGINCTYDGTSQTGTCIYEFTCTPNGIIELYQTPGTGSSFGGWTGCGVNGIDSLGTPQNGSDCVVSAATHSYVTATFTLNQYTVTTTAVNGTITSTVNPLVNHGSTTTVTGTANAGYYFASVSGCGGTPQNNADPSVTSFTYTTGAITAPCTVTATFAPKVQNGPDLTGTWQSLTEQTLLSFRRVGQYVIRGNLRVSNIGNQSAGSFRVSYYLSNDGVTLGTLLSQATVCGNSRLSRTCVFNAGQSVNLAFSHTSATSLKGKHIIAVIDSGNAVAETNEANNRAAGLIQ